MLAVHALRTPDDRFAGLPDFPFPPQYVEDLPGYEGLRAHYLDLGPRDAPHTFLCLYGEPDWCYLYRKMIPVLLESGARVIAPDFFGFGRSDKPARLEDYSFHFHRDFLLRLVERLDLHSITLVVADWGGILGLTLPVDPAFRSRLKRLVVMNTMLAVGNPLGEVFANWVEFVRSTPDLSPGMLVKQSEPYLTDAEAAAYDAPFPDSSYKAGVRAFPPLVMVHPDMEGAAESKAAADFWRTEWDGQSFMAISDGDPFTDLIEAMLALHTQIRGCPEPMHVQGAGHYVQEQGEMVARAALKSFGDL